MPGPVSERYKGPRSIPHEPLEPLEPLNLTAMTPAQFLAWRKARGWSQRQAGEALGISVSQIADYESGRKRGTDRIAPIPRLVALACAAIDSNIHHIDEKQERQSHD